MNLFQMIMNRLFNWHYVSIEFGFSRYVVRIRQLQSGYLMISYCGHHAFYSVQGGHVDGDRHFQAVPVTFTWEHSTPCRQTVE